MVKELRRPPSKGWAEMLRKVYEVDPLRCPQCGGKMKVIAFVIFIWPTWDEAKVLTAVGTEKVMVFELGVDPQESEGQLLAHRLEFS